MFFTVLIETKYPRKSRDDIAKYQQRFREVAVFFTASIERVKYPRNFREVIAKCPRSFRAVIVFFTSVLHSDGRVKVPTELS